MNELYSQESYYLEKNAFKIFFSLLNAQGYRIVGPRIHQNQAIFYEDLQGPQDLPMGWTDEQSPGKYRIFTDSNKYYFNFNCSPQSWKKYLNPSKQKLFSAKKNLDDSSFTITEEHIPEQKIAFLGMKACELSALAIQDNVFMHNQYKDLTYKIRRENILRISIDCLKASNTCFCTSMDQGPGAEKNFDLALSELKVEQGQIRESAEGKSQSFPLKHEGFLIRAGTEMGWSILNQLKLDIASEFQKQKVRNQVIEVAGQITRRLDTDEIKQNLFSMRNSSKWETVAGACLSCANCTMACPTCFCSSVEDVTDLSGEHTERWKRWDSCFTGDFSFVHGGAIRQTVASRYRQWATHKLAYWQDQFGESGCVGCGRCIAWCPVGIDLTEVANELQMEFKERDLIHQESSKKLNLEGNQEEENEK